LTGRERKERRQEEEDFTVTGSPSETVDENFNLARRRPT
jgi:hypothetical protein